MNKESPPITMDTLNINTSHLVFLADFYRQPFDLPDPEERPDHLGLDRSAARSGEQTGPISIWFRDVDLEAIYEQLLNLGARSKYPPSETPWGDRLAAVYDPDGKLVGLAQAP